MMMRDSIILVIVIVISVGSAGATELPDSGMVRILVDQVGVTVSLNGEETTLDFQGQPLQRSEWFIIPVPVGIHVLTLDKEGYKPLARSITVIRDEVVTVEADFPAADEDPASTIQSPSSILELSKLLVTSEPTHAKIHLGEEQERLHTPAELNLRPGDYSVSVSTEGFEPLTHQLSLRSGHSLSLGFLLKENQPAPVSAEEMGLEYKPVIPPINEEQADQLRRRFYSMAETFAIVPLGQGVLARMVIGEDGKREANALIITGAGLTIGSYLLGRIISARKLTRIRSRNEAIVVENKLAKEHNKGIDQIVREKSTEIETKWQAENQNRGRVVIRDR